jgi:Tripartite tricarboxylate transporter family receptor
MGRAWTFRNARYAGKALIICGCKSPWEGVMKTSLCRATTTRRHAAPHGNDRRLIAQHPRRRFLSLAAGAAALPAALRIARAQNYPTRPVRLIVGFPAGGPTDIIARIMAQYLSERLGQAFIIENRPGAASNVATETVVRARPDGYTLLEITATNAVNATLYDNLTFDLTRDIGPAGGIMRTPV